MRTSHRKDALDSTSGVTELRRPQTSFLNLPPHDGTQSPSCSSLCERLIQDAYRLTNPVAPQSCPPNNLHHLKIVTPSHLERSLLHHPALQDILEYFLNSHWSTNGLRNHMPQTVTIVKNFKNLSLVLSIIAQPLSMLHICTKIDTNGKPKHCIYTSAKKYEQIKLLWAGLNSRIK